MSSLPATRLVAAAPPRLAVTSGGRRQLFAYECRRGFPSRNSLVLSVVVHVIGIWVLAPIAFQARVEISTVRDAIAASEPTIIYSPSLPQTLSAPADASADSMTSEGMIQKSQADEIRVVSIASDTPPVVVASTIRVSNEESDLASMLAIGENLPTLAAQPIEIANDVIRPNEAPPEDSDLLNAQSRMQLPVTNAKVTLAPQPVEIEKGGSKAEPPEPAMLASNTLPTDNPALPVASGASIRLLNVPTIAGGSRSSSGFGARAGAAPAIPAAIGASGNASIPISSGTAVRLLNVPTIAGGSRGSAVRESSIALAPRMPTGVGAARGTGLTGALTGIGKVTVINPTPGPAIATGGMRAGRLAASPNGMTSGSGLGNEGTGASNAGTAGPSVAARGNGISGSGTGGANPIPSAGGTDVGDSVPISVTNGRLDLGSFGPKVDQPARGSRPAIVIVGSASASATLDRFSKSLRGDVYTVYLNASGTPAVLQFAEREQQQNGSFDMGLTPPESISTDLPKETVRRQVVSGVLNSHGRLTQIHTLMASSEQATAKLIRALEQWRFVPASRNETPVDVDVVIGFGIDTN